ncbi:MAG: hypothetical protein ACRC6K_00135, partial [Fusobacteriaceae bacterium]
MERIMEKTKKYIKVPIKIKNEIRSRYELGEDLAALAIEYKVNYNTLKNYSSKNEWVKGSRAEVIYLKDQEFLEEQIEEELRKLDTNHKFLYKHWLLGMIEEAKRTPDLKKSVEEARNMRVKSLDAGYELSRKLYKIKNTLEELEHDSKTTEHELLKIKLERAREVEKEISNDEE